MNATTHLPIYAADDSSATGSRSTVLMLCLRLCGLSALVALLALYIPGLEPKTLIVACFGIGILMRRTIWEPEIWPLIALCFYTALISALFSRSQPGLLDVFQNPGFQLLGVLLTWGCLRRCGVTTALALIYAVLAVSLIGLVGDLLGYDMTTMLPLPVPEEEFFDAITTTASGDARARGFFPEASILGAISVSFTFVAAISCWLVARARRSGIAYLCAVASGFLMLLFLGVTLAKTGMVMLVLGIAGFAAVNIGWGSWSTRLRAAASLLLAAGAAALLFASDTSLGGYLREEAEGLPIPGMGAPVGKVASGAQTRLLCWKLAYVNLKAHPLGVGHWGLGTTISAATGITPNDEMLFWFQRDNFSLKNALANIIAETGFVGLALLAYWSFRCYLVPAWQWRRRFGGQHLGVPGLYAACFLISLGLFFSCELYPYLAFALLLKVVADAVARDVQTFADQID